MSLIRPKVPRVHKREMRIRPWNRIALTVRCSKIRPIRYLIRPIVGMLLLRKKLNNIKLNASLTMKKMVRPLRATLISITMIGKITYIMSLNCPTRPMTRRTRIEMLM